MAEAEGTNTDTVVLNPADSKRSIPELLVSVS